LVKRRLKYINEWILKMNVDELYLTKLLVYGTATPGADPNTHIRPNTATAPSVTFSMIDYLTTGADTLYGEEGDDIILDGGVGNASFTGGAGDDTLIGGESDDTFHINRESGSDFRSINDYCSRLFCH
jgi:Ca2+-binding RTX toxin-like protein